MKIMLLSFVFILISTQAQGQTASADASTSTNLVRPVVVDELNKESSSFIGDADPLDPLPVKKENLKEDDEPVLEDIRQVIDAPAKKKTAKKVIRKKTTKTNAKNTLKKSSNKKTAKKSSARPINPADLNNDDPDANIENRFHQVYQRNNAAPTSEEAWSVAADGRNAEVYTVQKGDTLFTISQTLFGDTHFWPKIWALNRQGITNPHQISPGMKIYFYPGSADDMPTLEVGEAFETTASSASPATKIKLSSRNGVPTPVPDTFPIYRNERYYTKSKVLMVQLENRPTIEHVFTNDIILSDKIVTSDVTIPVEAISKQRCQENLIIKDVKFQPQSQGPYTIIESVFPVEMANVKIYPYRIIGEAEAISDKNLKVLRCSRGLTTEAVLVPTSSLPQVGTNKTSQQIDASLIGGPDVNEQMLYTFHQYAYVDLGQQVAEPGQVFKIKSQVTDTIHGQIKIIEKFGSYAVGVITDISDTVSQGDTVIP
ncbi:MAG: LysM peptidoglycan-binding domain-containing protein [Bdellovibrio sp.]|nr:LysM peptidoglycan-binding domain-containing protein [Bdellovibrio sp.]